MRKLVGENTARLRQYLGLTQEQLAERSGLSQQYLSGLERGKRNPTILTLYELALALEVHPADLLRPS
jgi:transcriptional regulator with XRE-family HTH domain